VIRRWIPFAGLAGVLVAGVVVAVSVLAGPAGGAPVRAVPAAASGIIGRAVSVACSGASSGGQACPERPVRATIEVVRLSSKRRVATVRTDASGRFRVLLAPGAYELRSGTTGAALLARPIDTQVRAQRLAQVIVWFYPRHPPLVAPVGG
jgi:hypothetical protein